VSTIIAILERNRLIRNADEGSTDDTYAHNNLDYSIIIFSLVNIIGLAGAGLSGQSYHRLPVIPKEMTHYERRKEVQAQCGRDRANRGFSEPVMSSAFRQQGWTVGQRSRIHANSGWLGSASSA